MCRNGIQMFVACTEGNTYRHRAIYCPVNCRMTMYMSPTNRFLGLAPLSPISNYPNTQLETASHFVFGFCSLFVEFLG